jgi:AraC family transcriptional regulator, regulatory protein of adaptative response / DNA-3-methyladenine glycosylase II
MLASFVAHAIPGVEFVDLAARTVRRAVRLSAGPAVVEAHVSTERVQLAVDHGIADDGELASLADRWFGLADDLDAVGRHFAADPVLGRLVRERPHLRIPGHPDGFEAAVQTVLGQQVSLAAARTFTGRFAAAFGSAGPGSLTLFPAPKDVVDLTTEQVQAAVRVTRARARTLVGLARACADGPVLAPGVDSGDARARLLAVPGIGPWTVEYLALRVLADRDAFPAGDLVLRRALGTEDIRAVSAASTRWSPLRAFAAQHLWTARAYGSG